MADNPTDTELSRWLRQCDEFANRGFTVEIDTSVWHAVVRDLIKARKRIAQLEAATAFVNSRLDAMIASIDTDLEDAG